MFQAQRKGNMEKILIVDDDTEHTKIIKELLEDCNREYEVICVNNGLECLELLDKLSSNKEMLPNLILLDIMMPLMDGWETFHHLRKSSAYKEIPVIFFSARKDFFAKKYGGFFGTDFLQKPYDVDVLFEKIKKIIKSY
jgi:CheY-like chemotaxis protein